jgi:hypothetical protein
MKRNLQLSIAALLAIVTVWAVLALNWTAPSGNSQQASGPRWNYANASVVESPKYTIFIRPAGALSVEYPPTFVRKAWQPPSYYINSTDPQNRTELWEDTAGTATYDEIMTACPSLKPGLITQIAQQRANTLGRLISSNAGITFVWSENLTASGAVLSGAGDQVVMKNGMTATEYCADMGAVTGQTGMTALEFANYVKQEAQNMAPAPYRVEREYMRLVYNVIPGSRNIPDLLALPAAYVAFCNQ